ncbi:MAG: cell division protein FtsZ [Eubacteriales bacterium]|nr:cell division protein FtsZ [Eubacteriales bacterium]
MNQRNRQVNIMAENDFPMDMKAYIKVFGVGGGGCNAVNRMISSGVQNVEFFAVNTDQQQLEHSLCHNTVRIGEKLTRGLGAGADPEIGAQAAEEAADTLKKLVSDADMVFITAGMGGGTGTGAAPVIARLAKEADVLTVAVVTKPFRFEGPGRMNHADLGIERLKEYVDALIIVPNDKLLDIAAEDTVISDSFAMADEILKFGVVGISDLVTVPGLINLDMMDVRRVMTDAGVCHMGIGRGKGPDAVQNAIDDAIHSPLLDTSIDGASRLIVNFTGANIRIKDFNQASTLVRDAAAADAEIIIGCVTDVDNLDEDEIMITVIASSFEQDRSSERPVEAVSSPRESRNTRRKHEARESRRSPFAPTMTNVAKRPEPRETVLPRASENSEIPDFLHTDKTMPEGRYPRRSADRYPNRPYEADLDHTTMPIEEPYSQETIDESYRASSARPIRREGETYPLRSERRDFERAERPERSEQTERRPRASEAIFQRRPRPSFDDAELPSSRRRSNDQVMNWLLNEDEAEQ